MSYLLQVDHIEKDINCTLQIAVGKITSSVPLDNSRDSKIIRSPVGCDRFSNVIFFAKHFGVITLHHVPW